MNHLLPIWRGFAVVNLSIIAIRNADDNVCVRRCRDVRLEVLLIYMVPDRGIVIQPVCLLGIRYFNFPARPIRGADSASDLEVRVLRVGRVAAGDRGGFKNSTNVQGDVVDRPSFSTECE